MSYLCLYIAAGSKVIAECLTLALFRELPSLSVGARFSQLNHDCRCCSSCAAPAANCEVMS